MTDAGYWMLDKDTGICESLAKGGMEVKEPWELSRRNGKPYKAVTLS
jgi:hypothetical protein